MAVPLLERLLTPVLAVLHIEILSTLDLVELVRVAFRGIEPPFHAERHAFPGRRGTGTEIRIDRQVIAHGVAFNRAARTVDELGPVLPESPISVNPSSAPRGREVQLHCRASRRLLRVGISQVHE